MNTILKRNWNRGLRKKRSRAKIFGTADTPRLSIFRSNRFMYVQLINDQISRTLAAASTHELSADKKKSKTEQARLLGELIAERAKKLGVKAAVFNKGAYHYHGRVRAVAEGAREGGLRL